VTTTVTAYPPYVMTGKKLQLIRRDVSGAETVLHDDLKNNVIVSECCWDGADLVFREVERPAPETAFKEP
jgi:hypothetical protein